MDDEDVDADQQHSDDDENGERAAEGGETSGVQKPSGAFLFDVEDDSLSEEDLAVQALKQRAADEKKKVSKPAKVKTSSSSTITLRPSNAEIQLQGINSYLAKKAERPVQKLNADQQFLMGLLEDFEKVPQDVKAVLKCNIITSIDNARKLQGPFAPQQPLPPPQPQPGPGQFVQPTQPAAQFPAPRPRAPQPQQPQQFNQNYMRTPYGGFVDALAMPSDLNLNELNGVQLDDIYFPQAPQVTPVSAASLQQQQQQQQQ